MWILSKTGQLIDVTGHRIITDRWYVKAIMPLSDGAIDWVVLAETATPAAAQEEVRRIAIAIASGAAVYEVGKGILQTKQNGNLELRRILPVVLEQDMQPRTPSGNMLEDGHEITGTAKL